MNTTASRAKPRTPFLAVALFLAGFLVPGTAPAWAMKIDVTPVTTDSGIEAWLVEDHSLPVITIKFAFLGGVAHDPEDKPGLAKLASVLLDEGAGDMKSQDFQAKLSTYAIGMSFLPGRDAFHGTLRTTSPHKDLAFNLLALALNKPRFDTDAIERMKNALTAEIRRNMGDPAWLSARTFNGVVFEGHPYARPGGGTLDSIPRITRRDLADFVRQQFARNLLKVVVVGDMTAEETRAMLDRVFGALPAEAPLPSQAPAQPVLDGKTTLLPLDTPQTYIAIALPGISRTDKDWYTALVTNYIFGGGGFDSRLMREVREKKGLTYGVYSSLVSQQAAHLLQITLSAGNEHTQTALDLIRAEIASLAATGVSRQELESAKAYLTGSLPLELTTTNDIAEALISLKLYDLPYTELANRNRKIQSVRASDVQAMARRLMRPENMTTILVGKPKEAKVDTLLDQAPGVGGAAP